MADFLGNGESGAVQSATAERCVYGQQYLDHDILPTRLFSLSVLSHHHTPLGCYHTPHAMFWRKSALKLSPGGVT